MSLKQKCPEDSVVKNKDKLEGAKDYFEELNKKLRGEFIYEFHFLDPRDYNSFFEKVIEKDEPFKGTLHAELESKTRSELRGEE